jgi:type IV pilus assembly protein PilB
VARLRLGELLVSSNVIAPEQLEEALRVQGETRRRLGDVLVQLGYVDETRLTQALSQQLAVPWVSLYHVDFSRQLLNLVPREVAERYCIVPIFVRRVRKVDTLYIGMDDPTNEAALTEVGQFSGLPVKPMIASPTDIRNAIRVYYGGEALEPPPTVPGQTAADSPQAIRKPPVPKQTLPDTAAARKAALEAIEKQKAEQEARKKAESIPASEIESVPPPSGDSPHEDPEIEAKLISVPKPKKGARAKMISLTLLDGTSIQLPARPGIKTGNEEGLTARDLVSALRAVTHGADASEILGENPKWEALFAALLSLLLKKGLIADWEFIEELRKV